MAFLNSYPSQPRPRPYPSPGVGGNKKAPALWEGSKKGTFLERGDLEWGKVIADALRARGARVGDGRAGVRVRRRVLCAPAVAVKALCVCFGLPKFVRGTLSRRAPNQED